MNTTKTLEELKKGGREYLTAESEDCPVWGHDLEKLDTFTEKVWNAALDACREKMPNETATEDNGLLNDDEARGFNAARGLALSAIDSLRSVGDKE